MEMTTEMYILMGEGKDKNKQRKTSTGGSFGVCQRAVCHHDVTHFKTGQSAMEMTTEMYILMGEGKDKNKQRKTSTAYYHYHAFYGGG